MHACGGLGCAAAKADFGLHKETTPANSLKPPADDVQPSYDEANVLGHKLLCTTAVGVGVGVSRPPALETSKMLASSQRRSDPNTGHARHDRKENSPEFRDGR